MLSNSAFFIFGIGFLEAKWALTPERRVLFVEGKIERIISLVIIDENMGSKGRRLLGDGGGLVRDSSDHTIELLNYGLVRVYYFLELILLLLYCLF